MVAIHRRDRSLWWFAGGILIVALLLFSALEARRQGAQEARGQAVTGDSLTAPDLIPDFVFPVVPPDTSAASTRPERWLEPGDERPPIDPAIPQAQQRVATTQPAFQQDYGDSRYQVLPLPPAESVDALAPVPEAAGPRDAGTAAAVAASDRIIASRLDNLSTTIIQGTLINAVLETALDSTRPGLARAVVTRDVYGFDGTRILIPRGTRLYGNYQADVSQGQKRAQIRWTRLLRPDGVSVALDSPAADPLGRAGVAGKVNNHFFERLGNAFVGAAGGIGSVLTRNVGSSPVVVAVPGSTQNALQTVVPAPAQIMPTLTVRQGTRITVFVQHDLDFTPVQGTP